MRKIVAITQVSIDGVMQAPGGPEEDPSGGFRQGGWAMSFVDKAAGRVIGKIMEGEFDLLLGRRTYQIFAGHWPDQENPIADAFNGATKYVVTKSLKRLTWKTSERIDGNIVARVRRLRSSKGPDLHIWGSSELLQTLTGAGLIDEYRLWVFPVVLGKGKRLFEEGVPLLGLELVETGSTPSGILFNTYRAVGRSKVKRARRRARSSAARRR